MIADVRASHEPGATDLKPLLKLLRTKVGSGGGLSDSPAGPEIVIQGDHKDAIVRTLVELGYRAKGAGG